MILAAVVAYLHYISFMVSFGALTIERVTLRPDLTLKDSWRVVITDAIYGVAATTVLITGILRVLYFGKGSEFYVNNPLFWAKVAVFLTIGTVSLYPTVSFISWISSLRENHPSKLSEPVVTRLQRILTLEIIGFSVIPLLAALMARGIGLGA